MKRFTTRVMLHFADEQEDYTQLHTEMEKHGFTRTIISDEDNKEYKLPTAEYNYIGESTRSEVLNKAKIAAKATNHKYAILVTPTLGRTWIGLEEVKKVN